MKLAIMQPYFFPYIGYFQLMNAVDKWIIFDNTQYMRHGWINRNRILSPNLDKEWQYIIVPLDKHSREDLINEIKINNTQSWRDDIIRKLTYYKSIRAPYYYETIELVIECLNTDVRSLLEINTIVLKKITGYLNIKFDYLLSSEEEFDLDNVVAPGDWALEISKHLKASDYINPIGGQKIFDKEKFYAAGINIRFLQSHNINYRQSKRKYVPWLSIIDLMMFNSIDKIKIILNEYKLE